MQFISDQILKKYSSHIFLVLIIIASFFAYHSKNLQLDASSDSLILENDKDLSNARTVSETYSSKEFLVITLSDKKGIISKENIEFIQSLVNQINELDWIDSTQSILDAPLLTINNQSLSDLVNEIKTISSKDIDLIKAEDELKLSPIFKELIISNDGTTSAILVNLKSNKRLEDLLTIKNSENYIKTKQLETEYQLLKKINDEKRHVNILEIRNLINLNKNHNIAMHLGGIPMIADDTITFVKNDIIVFGLGVLLLIIVVLLLIFKDFLWMLTALINCFFALVVMIGIVSFLNWKITVISSNFISLMLILTLSMTVHIIVRYRQLLIENVNEDKYKVINLCIGKMIRPCVFTALTTIFAFSTLYLSGIKPVMDFGIMMSLGLLVTLVTNFTLLPVLLSKFNLNVNSNKKILLDKNPFIITVVSYPKTIITAFIILLFTGIAGSISLKVENSFVDYFKKNTEIYKGMKIIDKNLGGTTPLDIIIQFKNNEEYSDEEDFLDFGIEYDPSDYWFTKEKINIIKNIHDHLETYEFSGKVLSLASLVRTAEKLNSNSEFDSLELAILYKKLPKELKDQILSPYLSIEKNQARISMRIIDTHKKLRRNEFLSDLDESLNNQFKSESYEASFSGVLVLYNNMLQSLFNSQIKSLIFVMLGIFIMLAILFRSIKIALVTIFPNIVACFTILGTMGYFGIPLDLMTITIASITIGIAVDNCIHYVYRYKEYFSETNDYLKTVSLCQNSVGKAIRNTSLTIIAGFSILVFSNFYPTIYFGIFTALAMLIALLGSLTLLPILLKYINVQ
tara:strand:+ start:1792 stop:4188 length:2397 start_codon:yes stop_codon:yes gene_type:complete